ncbi:DNA mismatch repair protein MutT [Rhizobium sp. Root708]|uniref:NUDIX hydrolase n=1 Tax=Rhizobium sp. Root708 TaxID=1736592 RepID=UPI0007016491|nr:NUDIX domain-containing protein [Rhizobium sp. Root708]KRB62137.1 DNA mismatch repair protein MutT [Rhizobium sp. Root708]
MERRIQIAAALLTRNGDETLLVRKKGTSAFMQPGGKLEPDETAEQALVRELQEELGLEISSPSMRYLGHFQAGAANEPDHLVVADVFEVEIGDQIARPTAEIAEIRWISINGAASVPLAPLTRDHILPHYRRTVVNR